MKPILINLKNSFFLSFSKRRNKNASPFFCTGFTLIEVLTVIALMALLLGVGTISIASLRTTHNLSAAADIVKITLEKARLSSLVREDGSGYSLKLNGTNLVLFKGSTYNPSDASNKMIGLPTGIEITTIDLSGGGSAVVFSGLSGTTTPGTIILSSATNPDQTRTIYIDGSGRVFQSNSAAADGGGGGGGGISQTTDTGHQDFDLGWSIQTTSELKLSFLTDPPETQTSITEPHFNGDRSVFNYVGSFNASGIAQTIRIYSNNINTSNTVLSITRDPSDVNLPLEISIDGHIIVTYLGDGTMLVGAFGGTVVGN